MKKKHVFLAGVALAVLLAYSCRMPDSIEIRTGNRELSVPLNAEVNIADLFRDAFEDAFDDNGDINVRIFDMENMGPAQTFLIAIELGIIPSPGDYLGFLGDQESVGKFSFDDIDPIDISIEVPEIDWSMIDTFYFDMNDLFVQMDEMLHGIEEESRHLFSLPGELSGLPPEHRPSYISLPPRDGFPALDPIEIIDFSEDHEFETIIADIKIDLELRVTGVDSPAAGLRITLTEMKLEGVINKETGNPFDPWDATLTHTNDFQHTVPINLIRAEIKYGDTPRFSFGDLRIEWDDFDLFVAIGGFDLFINTRLEEINFRGATGLIFEPIPQGLPDNIAETIINADLGNIPEGFLNADIGVGILGITIGLPSGEGNTTHVSGLEMDGIIDITQEATIFNGIPFYGVNAPWEFTGETPVNLGGTRINGGKMAVNQQGSNFIVSPGAGGMSFELFGDYSTLPIGLELGISLDVLDAVRWDIYANDDFNIDPVEINFSDLIDGDMVITDLINNITLGDITLTIDFKEPVSAIDDAIKIAIYSQKLGFEHEYFLTTSEPNVFIGGDKTLSFYDPDPIMVDIELSSADGTGYLTIGPLDLNEVGGSINLAATVGLYVEWTEAEVSMYGVLRQAGMEEGNLSGSFPEDEPIEFGYQLGDIMSGFTFAEDSIALELFLDGPDAIINAVRPRLKLSAVFDDEGSGELLIDKLLEFNEGEMGFPILPDGDVFSGDKLPEGGLALDVYNFVQMIADMPDYLSFVYDIELGDEDGTITVTPEMFDKYLGGDIRVMVLLKLALDFHVRAGGYLSLPLFDEDQADLFGREELGDPFFDMEGLTFNSLGVRLEFGDSLFKGASLQLTREDFGASAGLFSENGLPLNDGRSGNLEFALRRADWDIINANLIPPDIRIIYREAQNLRITRDLMPTRITVSANASFTLNFNDDEG